MKTLLQPQATEISLHAVMGALSDPVRVAIVRTLAVEGEKVCGTFEVGVSNATRSHHFRVPARGRRHRHAPRGDAGATCRFAATISTRASPDCSTRCSPRPRASRPRRLPPVSGVWDPARPELDTVPPWDLDRPARTYVVCSTPRSGSGLLVRGMAATGLAGTPAEYFNVNQRGPLAARWGAGDSVARYVTALRRHRTSPGGVLGVKLHWDQLEQLRAEVLGLPPGEPGFELSADFLLGLLPGARFVHILRRDVERQAVSLWVALSTGVWSLRRGARAGPAPAVPYSFAAIDQCRTMIVNSELHWDRFFRSNGIEPVRVVYEDLAEAYPATIAAVVQRALGTRPAAPVPAPDSHVQHDERAGALLARYAEDRSRRVIGPPGV